LRHVLTVKVEKVEGVESNCGPTVAIPQRVEGRFASPVQRYDFAINDRSMGFNKIGDLLELGESLSQVVSVPRDEPDLAIFQKAECAVTIPFWFKEPLRIRKGKFDWCWEHRFDGPRHSRVSRRMQSIPFCSLLGWGHLGKLILALRPAPVNKTRL